MIGRWTVLAVLGIAMLGCIGGITVGDADDWCLDEAERAASCGQPFDLDGCFTRAESCGSRDVEPLIAFHDCLQSVGYGVCGECINVELLRSCTGVADEASVETVETCQDTLYSELSNPCADEFDGCDGIPPDPRGLAFLPPMIVLWRRRRA